MGSQVRERSCSAWQTPCTRLTSRMKRRRTSNEFSTRTSRPLDQRRRGRAIGPSPTRPLKNANRSATGPERRVTSSPDRGRIPKSIYVAYRGAHQEVREATERTRDPAREENAPIRVWAREHGFSFSERGNIPNGVRAAYLHDLKKSDQSQTLTRDQSNLVRTVARASTRAQTHEVSQRIRAWAREHDYAVSGRGQIPREILAAYLEDHEGD